MRDSARILINPPLNEFFSSWIAMKDGISRSGGYATSTTTKAKLHLSMGHSGADVLSSTRLGTFWMRLKHKLFDIPCGQLKNVHWMNKRAPAGTAYTPTEVTISCLQLHNFILQCARKKSALYSCGGNCSRFLSTFPTLILFIINGSTCRGKCERLSMTLPDGKWTN